MDKYQLKAAPTAKSKEQNSQKEPKAKRILIGVDVHLKSYEAAHKLDNGAVGSGADIWEQRSLLALC